MLEYSSEGRAARLRLYGSDPNLVSVYVEDKDKEYFYDEIMKRLLRDKAVHTKVFGLGGKTQVVEQFNPLFGSGTAGRRSTPPGRGTFSAAPPTASSPAQAPSPARIGRRHGIVPVPAPGCAPTVEPRDPGPDGRCPRFDISAQRVGTGVGEPRLHIANGLAYRPPAREAGGRPV